MDGMNETLYLSYPPRLSGTIARIKEELLQRGHWSKDVEEDKLEGSLVLLFLDMDSSVEEIYASAPWLKKQFDYSSLKALRLMPFLLYRSSLGSVEDQFEEHLSETVEEVLSGEFKPYGYDLDAADPWEEFESVLENYEE